MNEKSGKDRSNNERNSRPRAIICRMLRFKDKQRIIQTSKKLINTGIFIYEDFCKGVMGEGTGASSQQQNFLFELSKHGS